MVIFTYIQVSDKNNDDDDDDNAEESRKKKESNMKLQETAYEALGKAWPSNKDTQGCKKIYNIRKVFTQNKNLIKCI